jgi:periplasmic mercuric ion binding protein
MMKPKFLSLTALFVFGAMFVFAGTKTEKIKVLGACGMCETRIEKTTKAIDGVSKADWTKDTQVLEVTFNDAKTSVDKIEKALADIGHDTEKYKASDAVYQKLPACCHYDRTGFKK